MHSIDGLAESCWSYCLFLSFHQETQKRLGHTLYVVFRTNQTHQAVSLTRATLPSALTDALSLMVRCGSRLLWVGYRLQCSRCINSPASADLSRFCLASICWWSAHCCPDPATIWSRHACSFAPPCGRWTQCQAVETAACATSDFPGSYHLTCHWKANVPPGNVSLLKMYHPSLISKGHHCTQKDHLLHKACLDTRGRESVSQHETCSVVIYSHLL